jgi:hypothetical protein
MTCALQLDDPMGLVSRLHARLDYETGMLAFAAATGGSLCVRTPRLPKDFSRVITALRGPNSRVQLVVCAQTPEDYEPNLAVPITVPPLASRPDEIDRIITEYAEDAITELGTPRTGFLSADREWVRTHSASTLPDIEKATLRLVAIRESRKPQQRGSAARDGAGLADALGRVAQAADARRVVTMEPP